MRFILIGFLVFNFFLSSSAQGMDQINFIIEINEEIAVSSIARARIIKVDLVTEKEIIFDVSYFPGLLTFADSDLDVIFTEDSKVSLVFDYYSHDGNNYYEIELNKNWLLSSYCILRIYDLTRIMH